MSTEGARDTPVCLCSPAFVCLFDLHLSPTSENYRADVSSLKCLRENGVDSRVNSDDDVDADN